MMRRQLLPAIVMLCIATIVTGVAYPLAMTAVGQLAFTDNADGSLIVVDGTVVGSRLIGQPFTEAKYFHPRPSATGYAPGPASAYGSNEGPTSDRLLFGVDDPTTDDIDESTTTGVDDRVRAYRAENGLGDDAAVPVDAVTGSASSLDPHISLANASIQARRVANERGLDLDAVNELIALNTESRPLGFLGEPGVNVTELNLALDRL